MDRNRWLKGEIAAWRAEGLVDERTAARLLARYGGAAGRASWGILLAGVFGGFLVALGVIALVAANWEAFGRAARTALAVGPVAVCGAVAAWAAAKGKTGAAWMETLGVLWLGAVAAGATIVAQTYQIGDSVSGLLLFISALGYPVLWATRGRVATVVWTVFALVCVGVQCDERAASQAALLWELAAMTALSAAAWTFAARSRGEGGLTASARGAMGLDWAFGVPLMLVVLADMGPWRVQEAWCFGFFFAGAALVGLAGGLTGHRAWCVAGTLVAVGAALPTFLTQEIRSPHGLMLVWYCGSLVYAAALAVRGIWRRDLWVLNAGVLLGAWLVLAKFFESRVDFTVKGVVLIGAGVAVWGLNAWLVRMKKREAAK